MMPGVVRAEAGGVRAGLGLVVLTLLLAATGGELAWSLGGGVGMVLLGMILGVGAGVGVVWGVGVGVMVSLAGREERIREETELLRFHFLDAHAVMCERSERGYALDVSYSKVARESLSQAGEVLERIEAEVFGLTTIQLGHLEAELDEAQIAMSLESLVESQAEIELVREHAPGSLTLLAEEISLPGWIRVQRRRPEQPQS